MTPEPRVTFRSRVWRWVVRSIVAVLVIAVIVVVLVESVRRSDLVRQITVEQLSARTGLRVEIESVRATWFNGTVVEGVRLGLPFEEGDVVVVERMEVEHRSIPMLVATRAPGPVAIKSDQVDLNVTTDADGQWNLVEATNIIVESIRDQPPSSGAVPVLPRIHFPKIVVNVSQDGVRREFPTSSFSMTPRESHEYQIEGAIGTFVVVDGAVAPRASWSHNVGLTLRDVETLAAQFVSLPESMPSPLNASLAWEGRKSGEQWVGRLDVREATDDVRSANATLRVALGPLGAELKNVNGTISGVLADGQPLSVSGASVAWRDGVLSLHDADVSSGSDRAFVNGSWNPSEHLGALNAQWDARRDGINYAGQGQVAYERDQFGVGVVEGSVSGTLDRDAMSLVFDVTAQVHVESVRASTATVNASVLRGGDGDVAFDLSGLRASVSYNDGEILVHHARDPAGQVDGAATYNLESAAWTIAMSSRVWPLTGLDFQPSSLDVVARGEPGAAQIERFVLESELGSAELAASVTWEMQASEPILDGEIEFSVSPPSSDATPGTADESASWNETTLHAQVEGQFDPLELSIAGTLTGHDVRYETRRWRQITVPLEAKVNQKRVHVETNDVEILGGRLRVQSDLDLASRDLRAHVDGFNLNLATIAELLESDLDVGGIVDVNAEVRLPGLDAKRSEVWGDWALREANLVGQKIDTGSGRFRTVDAWIELHDLEVTHGTGSLTGTAKFDPARSVVEFDTVTRSWAMSLPSADVSSTLDADIGGVIDFAAGTHAAQGQVSAEITRRDAALGPVSAAIVLENDVLSFDAVQADWFGGQVTGSGRLVGSDMLASTCDLRFDNVNLASLSSQFDGVEPLVGTGSGELHVAPETDPRAMERLGLRASFRATDGRFGAIPIGDGEIIAFFGEERWVLDRGRLDVAGGSVNTWGRLSRLSSEPHWFVDASFENVRLRPFLLEADVLPQGAVLPGRLAGSLSGSGALRPPHRAVGRGRVQLTGTDLGTIPAINTLYSLLSLNLSGSKPEGQGLAEFRLEDDRLEMTRLEYFNRGVDIVARLSVADIWAGAASPVSGFAVGAVRPLKASNISLLRQLDKGLKAVQTETGAVRISGTVGSAQVEPVPFESVTNAVSAALSR